MQVAFSGHTALHTYTADVSQTRVSMCVILATYTTKRRVLMHKRKKTINKKQIKTEVSGFSLLYRPKGYDKQQRIKRKRRLKTS